MNVLVLRHGKAEPAGSGINDADRVLTSKGKDEISRLAVWLSRRDEKVDLIMTSPLKRAVETAGIIARTLKIEDVMVSATLVPGFNPDYLSHEITSVHNGDCVMIVGHEPDLSSFIGLTISGNSDAAVVMAKGALAKIGDFQFGDRSSGELLWLVTPDLLKGCK